MFGAAGGWRDVMRGYRAATGVEAVKAQYGGVNVELQAFGALDEAIAEGAVV